MTDTAVMNDLTNLLQGGFLETLDGYDGAETILIPNEIHKFQSGVWSDAPQPVQYGEDKLLSYPARTKFNLRLTSTALRITNTATRQGRIDFNAVTMGTREMEIFFNGKWITDSEYIAMIMKAVGKDQRASEQIMLSLRERGLDITNEMPMYLQHLSASKDEFHRFVEFLVSQGATENLATVRNTSEKASVAESYRFTTPGLEVLEADIGRVSRKESQNNSGFIGFLDATYTTMQAIVLADRSIRQARAIMESADSTEDEKLLAQAQFSSMARYWNSGMQRDLRPVKNWGGTTRAVSATGITTLYATSVPCGRLVLADREGAPHEFSFWQRNATVTEAEAPDPLSNEALDLSALAAMSADDGEKSESQFS